MAHIVLADGANRHRLVSPVLVLDRKLISHLYIQKGCHFLSQNHFVFFQ